MNYKIVFLKCKLKSKIHYFKLENLQYSYFDLIPLFIHQKLYLKVL